MIEVEQTLFTREEGGNCFAACVASIFEVPLDAVPNPALVWREDVEDKDDRDARAWEMIGQFFADLGVVYCEEPVDGCRGWRPPGFWIATVDVDGARHSVVMEGERLAWDPHPERDSGRLDLNRITDVCWFVVADPARLARSVARFSPSVVESIRPYLRPVGARILFT